MRTARFLLALLTSCLTFAQSSFEPPTDPTLKHIISDWRNPKSHHPYSFPNDLARDIPPIGIHSHNDFWRNVPLFSALSVGAISVEADLFYRKLDTANSTNLYVGHDVASLDTKRTLKSLYLDPLIYILKRNNPNSPFMKGNSLIHGVYSTDVLQTLYLFIDWKTPLTSSGAKETFLREIDALVKLDYTTTVRRDPSNNEIFIRYGPVTIVFTGDNGGEQSWDPAPKSASGRPYFYDGSLPNLRNSTTEAEGRQTTEYSLIASGDFMKAIGGSESFKPSGDRILTDEQKAALKKQIDVAHGKGMLVRYWNTPGWPARVRRGVWRELVELGVDLLNVDQLEEAQRLNW